MELHLNFSWLYCCCGWGWKGWSEREELIAVFGAIEDYF